MLLGVVFTPLEIIMEVENHRFLEENCHPFGHAVQFPDCFGELLLPSGLEPLRFICFELVLPGME